MFKEQRHFGRKDYGCTLFIGEKYQALIKIIPDDKQSIVMSIYDLELLLAEAKDKTGYDKI